MLRLVVVLCAAALVHGQTTEVGQCIHHTGPLPINTYVVGCGQPPCELPQLQDAVINIIFRAPHTMHAMTTYATAFVSGATVNYPLFSNGVTCNFLLNTYCPVVAGEVIQYQLRMYIQLFFQVGVQPDIEFRIVDAQSNPVMCIRVPIRIVPAVNSRGVNATLTDHA